MSGRLRIGFLSTLYHTSHLIRQDSLIEKKLGVQSLWRLYGTGPAMVEAFRRQEIDLAFIGLPPAMIGISTGVPLVCIGGGHVEGTLIVGGPSFRSLEESRSLGDFLVQFQGLKVGIPSRGSIHDVIFRHLLERQQVAGVKIVNYSWADLILHGLRKKEVDAAVGTPPLAVLCEKEFGMRVLAGPQGLWPFNPSYGIVATRRALEDEASEILEGFLEVHEECCNLLRECPGEAARTVSLALPGVEEAFVLRTLEVSPRYCASLPGSYVRSCLEFGPVLARMGYMERLPAESEIFDLRLISKVHPGAHHYGE